ncbi:NADPH-dependent FMN reductase [Sphaerisporangium album]|nr:NAD(P)H-dependent oxidoreductase [Sphaerisporangium album]
MKVVGIAGSLLSQAYVRRLLDAAGKELPTSADFRIWDGLDRIPPVSGDTLPRPVEDLCQALSAADGVIIAAPAHSVLPAQLVHALDWMSSSHGNWALLGKPVIVLTSCVHPYESMWTQTLLRRSLSAAGALVHSADLPTKPTPTRFDPDGRLADPKARHHLRKALTHLRPPTLTATITIPTQRTMTSAH